MSGPGFAPVDELFLAEDLDAGRGGGQADGEADQEGHLGDVRVVERGGEDLVRRVEQAAEVDAVSVQLRQADEEACESADAHFGEEAPLQAILLDDGADKAKVDLSPPRCAAGLDRLPESIGFLCDIDSTLKCLRKFDCLFVQSSISA